MPLHPVVRSVRRLSFVAIATLTLTAVAAAPALACSPLSERPTIADLGPDAVVIVGTIGERVDGGRLFHVRRAYSGGVTSSPIVVAFKEGEGLGDCSYPVSQGTQLVIATVRDAQGRIPVDVVTMQADPTTPDGQQYIAEAESLFGPGIVPTVAAGPSGPSVPVLGLAAVALLIVGGGLAWRWAIGGHRRDG